MQIPARDTLAIRMTTHVCQVKSFPSKDIDINAKCVASVFIIKQC